MREEQPFNDFMQSLTNLREEVKDVTRLIFSLSLWNVHRLMARGWWRLFIATYREQRINLKCMTSWTTRVLNVWGLVMFADITGTYSELHWDCHPLCLRASSCSTSKLFKLVYRRISVWSNSALKLFLNKKAMKRRLCAKLVEAMQFRQWSHSTVSVIFNLISELND